MWATLKSDILSRLPRHRSNGAMAKDLRANHQNSHPQEWDKRIEELEAFRTYKHDWDGQGAEAPSSELMDSAVNLAHQLIQTGIDAPSCVVPGVNGTVVFEWQGENGSYLEIEITAPDRADGCMIVQGKQTESWAIQ